MPRATKTSQKAQARPTQHHQPYAKRTPPDEGERQTALAIHAPCALGLAHKGLELARAWETFARDALATDPRLPLAEARRLDATFQVSASALRTLCEALSAGAARLRAHPKEEEEE